MSAGGPVMVFDGQCHLCSRTVQFVLKHERKTAPEKALRFAPIQGQTGRRLALENGVDPDDPSSFLLIADGTTYLKADGAVRTARYLRWPWSWGRAGVVLPGRFRAWLYDRVARNRYRLFGRSDACMLPPPGTAQRFLA